MEGNQEVSLYPEMNNRLRKYKLQILEEMEPKLFMHQMVGCCFHRVTAQSIEVLPTRHARVEKLLFWLKEREVEIYVNFCKAIAGVHPDLFHLLTGKSPNVFESEHVILPYIEKVQDQILKSTHVTDRPEDTKIDLATQYVQLRLTTKVDGDNEEVQMNHPPDRVLYAGEKSSNKQIKVLDVLNEEGETPRSVVFKGRPGIGKTTTVQWLARKWATKQWGERYSIFFFLQLRKLCLIRDKISLWKLLANYGLYRVSHQCLGEDTLHVWLEKNQQHILIHLDGLDEISEFQERFETCHRMDDICEEADALETCINLIKGNLLPKATIIITSRPSPVVDVVKPERVIQLMGLTRAGVLEYVDKFTKPEQRAPIKEQLMKNPVIMSLCGIPFYCTVICKLLKECPKLQVQNLETYTRLHAFIILKLLARNCSSGKCLSCPNAIVDDAADILVPLARLATQGFATRPQKLVFEEEELYQAGITDKLMSKAKESGLLLVEQVQCENNEWPSKNLLGMFIHLTIQEFLASGCMFLQKAEYLDSAIRKERFKGDFNMALAFLYGIVYDKDNKHISVIKNALGKLESPPTGFWNWLISWFHPWNHVKKAQDKLKQFYMELCQCVESSPEMYQSDLKLLIMQLAQESQQMDLAKIAADHVTTKGNIAMSGVTLTAVDITAMTYVLGCTKNVTGLRFENSNLDDISLKLVSPFLQELNIQTLDLRGNQISDDGMLALSEVLTRSCMIQSLNLSKNDITDDGLSTLSKALGCANCSISCLDMSSNAFGDKGAVTLARALGKNHSLTKIYLNENEIGNEGATLLAQALEERNSVPDTKAPRIKIIELRDNQIGDNGAEALRLDLPARRAPKVIDLRRNQISSDWIKKYNSKEMNLAQNTTGAKRVRGVIDELREKRRPWQSLKLTKQKMNCCDTQALVNQLYRCTTVSLLDLRGNQITERNIAGIELLASTNPALTCIKLKGNPLSKEIIEAFEDCGMIRKSAKRLVFFRHTLCEMWCQNVVKSVQMNEKLENLELVDVSQASLLLKELETILKCPNLSSLILQRCFLSPNDIRSICDNISGTGHIKVLDLSHNPMGPENISLIATLLRDSPKLERLSLSDARVHDQGAKEIFQALECTDSSLKYIDLSCNELIDEGAKAAAKCLGKDCRLEEVNLGGNRISREGALAISSALCGNNTLRHLILANNGFGDDVVNEFLHLMKPESQCQTTISIGMASTSGSRRS